MAVPVASVGTRSIDLLSISASPKPVAVTVITPTALVATDSTYFEVWVAVDSQPQALAATCVSEPVWYTSEIVVRQAEAASTTSDSFARLVKSWYAGRATAARIPMIATTI